MFPPTIQEFHPELFSFTPPGYILGHELYLNGKWRWKLALNSTYVDLMLNNRSRKHCGRDRIVDNSNSISIFNTELKNRISNWMIGVRENSFPQIVWRKIRFLRAFFPILAFKTLLFKARISKMHGRRRESRYTSGKMTPDGGLVVPKSDLIDLSPKWSLTFDFRRIRWP